MAAEEVNGTADCNGNNATPSTASRIKPAPVENAFPTPPRRNPSRASDQQQDGRQSPIPGRLFGISKSSPAVKEYKSQEILRTSVSKGNSAGLSIANELEKSQRSAQVSKKNSQYFDQVFAVRESYYSPKERVTRDALLVIELQMNCCVRSPGQSWMTPANVSGQLDNEQSFLNDFLMTLSEIYKKPADHIVIVATTNVHIMLGASTEPAYVLALTGLENDVSSTKNSRTVTIVQDFLTEALQIPAHRGVVKFRVVPADQIGTNGMTMQDEIRKLEADEKRGLSLRSRQSNRTKRGSTMPSMSEALNGHEDTRSSTPIVQPTNPFETEDEMKDSDLKPTRATSSPGRMMRGKKSFMNFWKKGSSHEM